jgi:tRNA G18 (ribose-2'-O)-methylase SpoU
LQAAGFDVWAMTPAAGAQAVASVPVSGKTAILLGAEGPGLPQSLIDQCRPVRIPMATGFDSVNVATAGAIALSRLFASR